MTRDEAERQYRGRRTAGDGEPADGVLVGSVRDRSITAARLRATTH